MLRQINAEKDLVTPTRTHGDARSSASIGYLWIDAKVGTVATPPAFVRAAPADILCSTFLLQLVACRHAHVVAQAGVALATARCVLRIAAAWSILRRYVAIWEIAH